MVNGDCSASGSTRAWRKLREEVEATLPAPCGHCGDLVYPGTPWVLGHNVDRVHGGRVTDGVRPEHKRCSDSSGGRLVHEVNGRGGPSARVAERRGRPAVRTLASSVCAGSASGEPGRCARCVMLGADCNGRGAWPGYGPGLPPSRAW